MRPVSVAQRPQRKVLSANAVFFIGCVLLLVIGWYAPIHRYLSPHTGIGYALGIIGGSLMLLLLLYPLRKRVRWLGFMGSVKAWFQVHMVLGILGPLCILYHSNFSFGAVNSNIALFCMLTVSGSGLIGRYLYIRIHHGLTERATTVAELQANAERLRGISLSLPFMPQLLQHLVREETSLMQDVSHSWLLFRPLHGALRAAFARHRLNVYVRKAMQQAASSSAVIAAQRPRLNRATRAYVRERITAARRVCEFQAYTRLFSLWHVLHLPLFFMLVIAGIVHVIAVNVY